MLESCSNLNLCSLLLNNGMIQANGSTQLCLVDDDDDDMDLFGDETWEEKKAAEEREAAKKDTK
ncbi:unnamed protein product [Eruca vesicaria subsp. sativa]|uniref:Uncharacterized protein n=1 Tax=Eruca vesicaria subsp. sativa TaxID=29727 RepID=A0ABC8LGS8_ERUVS|nr:unnamed protein product [Eruca vesicaria subsp. sativa]